MLGVTAEDIAQFLHQEERLSSVRLNLTLFKNHMLLLMLYTYMLFTAVSMWRCECVNITLLRLLVAFRDQALITRLTANAT